MRPEKQLFVGRAIIKIEYYSNARLQAQISFLSSMLWLLKYTMEIILLMCASFVMKGSKKTTKLQYRGASHTLATISYNDSVYMVSAAEYKNK